MKELSLAELIVAMTPLEVNCKQQGVKAKGVSTDTRSLKKGDIYFALKGNNFDGHDFVSIAQTKGACAVVCSKDVDTSLPVLKVKDTLSALQNLAAYYRAKFNIPIIAVTGSNGKTTAKNMIATVLAAKFRVFFTDKNYNNEIGLPKSMLELDDSYDVAVFEMGMNHFGEIETLSNIAKPDIAVITNIGKAHIGNLGSQENILKAKLEILNGLKKNGLLLLNADDKFLRGVKSDTHEVVFVGELLSQNKSLSPYESNSQISAENIQADDNPSSFDVVYKGQSYPCSLPAIGKHNVTNALFALYCGLRLGIGIKQAIDEIKRFTVSSMRTETAYVKGITIIKDYYNSSPDSARAALEVLANYPSSGKKIALLGEIFELGDFSAQEHINLAKTCNERKIDYTFFIGADYECFQKEIKDGKCFSDRERDAFSKSIKNYISSGSLNKGDVILIKGSRGMKMEEFYEPLKSYINAVMSDSTHLPPSATKLYVDINAVKFNYSQIKKEVGSHVEIMPMVKANAYGCGTDIIANIFRNSKYLAVADVKEAALIRRILPKANIVIIYQPCAGDIEEIVSGGYTVSVSNLDFAKKLDGEAGKHQRKIKIHIEVDTGAGRLGLNIRECADASSTIKALGNLIVEGVFMHYVCADSFEKSDLEFTKRQTVLFKEAAAEIESVLGEIPYKHACAGAAIFNQNAAHFNMVRPGYMLYGYYPSDALRGKILLKPVLKFVSVILQIKEYEKGTPISYNRRFVTKRKSRIATVSAGYSDGISRKLFNPKNKKNGCFAVNGQRAPIVGTICMDLTMIDITDIKGDVNVGDEAAIFDNVNVTVEEMATICGTIGYEIISQIEDKADRVESF
ncbi:MAG: alanine racemase [Treponema sp.]|jgi:alanine racemase|nr:alanine racemase [Treponema sp.]